MGDLPFASALTIDYVPLDDVVGADRNARIHDVPGIAGSIARLGFGDPAVRDERTGKLVGGHGRLKALRWLRDRNRPAPTGIDPSGRWRVPVTRGWRSLDDAHAEAMNTALNRWGELGGYDKATQADILTDLFDYDPSLAEAAGHSAFDLEQLLADLDADAPDLDDIGGSDDDVEPGREDDDERDEHTGGDPEPIMPTSRPGDVWLLGAHRLVVGDGEPADLAVADAICLRWEREARSKAVRESDGAEFAPLDGTASQLG